MKNIDFLPESYRQARRLQAMRVRRMWLGGAFLCALATWFAVDEVRVHRTRAQVGLLAEQNQTVQTSLEHIARLQAEQAVLLERYKLIRELQPGVSCVATLCRIAELLPEAVVLRQLQFSCGTASGGAAEPAGGVKAQAAGPPAVRMALAGLAPSQVDIAVLVGQLSGCREFANVRLDYSKACEIDSRQAYEFRVTLDVPAAGTGAGPVRGV